MSESSTITLGALIVCLGFCITLWGFFNSYKKSIKEDEERRNKEQALASKERNEANTGIVKANIKLDNLCKSNDDIRMDVKTLSAKITELSETQVKHETVIEAIQKDMKEFNERINKLENGGA